ncbi:MAG: SEC-C domain-containing protein [Anaerolineae bacterium]|nr:SEC-C domain-containing protein [Anaerolineae bacterium]
MEANRTFPRVGRNDPCPCGSGKKYKNCHMRQAEAAEAGALREHTARKSAFDKLAAFVQGNRFLPDVAEAMTLFWDGRLQPGQIDQVQPIHRLRALDFFLFDYRTAEGDHIVDRFLAERGSRLSGEERAVVRYAQQAHVSLYRSTGSDSRGVTLEDMIEGTGVRLERGQLPPPLVNPQIALIGRLAMDAPAYFISDLVLPMPMEVAERLVEWLKPRFAAYQAGHPGATWPQFLRAEGQVFNAFLMADADFLPAPEESDVALPSVDDDVRVAEGIVRQMHGGLIVGTLDSHYGQYLDRPIAEWGNRSPRQLMADEVGRERVELWLEALERAEANRRAVGQPAYDVNRLRSQLGLLGPGVF